MENGLFVAYTVEPNEEKPFLIDIVLTFDITGWKKSTGYDRQRNENIGFYEIDPNDKVPNLIALCFEGARDIEHSDHPEGGSLVDIYFSNTTNRRLMYRANLPDRPVVIPRPYCSFYMAGHQLIIGFSEDECRISATFAD